MIPVIRYQCNANEKTEHSPKVIALATLKSWPDAIPLLNVRIYTMDVLLVLSQRQAR